MPFIDQENDTVVIESGYDTNIGAVEIKDADTETRAEVTTAGLTVDVNNFLLIGDSVEVLIDAIERRLDTTGLAAAGYPFVVELEARAENCYLKQGNSAITLNTGTRTNSRLLADTWRLATVSGVNEAYFAIERASTSSGVLVATRLDSL